MREKRKVGQIEKKRKEGERERDGERWSEREKES